jgi:hypothetical protein
LGTMHCHVLVPHKWLPDTTESSLGMTPYYVQVILTSPPSGTTSLILTFSNFLFELEVTVTLSLLRFCLPEFLLESQDIFQDGKAHVICVPVCLCKLFTQHAFIKLHTL